MNKWKENRQVCEVCELRTGEICDKRKFGTDINGIRKRGCGCELPSKDNKRAVCPLKKF